MLQFRASADAGLRLEVAVSLRSSLFPSPRHSLGSPESSAGLGKGCCDHRDRWDPLAPSQSPLRGLGAVSGIVPPARGFIKARLGAKLGFDQILKTWEFMARAARF